LSDVCDFFVLVFPQLTQAQTGRPIVTVYGSNDSFKFSHRTVFTRGVHCKDKNEIGQKSKMAATVAILKKYIVTAVFI
jgi:hypothetical protein